MRNWRFETTSPLTGLVGCLVVLILIPLLPILLLIFVVFLIFGRTINLRKQYERFRDSRFYRSRRSDDDRPDDPDVCDVECTVISSETVDDDK